MEAAIRSTASVCSGGVATLMATMPSAESRSRASSKNSLVARWKGMYGWR
jgi:hypothetical protein